MADTTATTAFRLRRPRLRGSTKGIRSMSERQLEAYFQARDALRRVRAVAALTSDIRRDASPPTSAI